MDTQQEMTYLPADRVLPFVKEVFLKTAVREDVAEQTARGLWMTSLRGVDTHGVRLVPHYVLGVQEGRINPHPKMDFKQTSMSTGLLDADHTFGHAGGIVAMHKAIELAHNTGSGFVAVKNSSHCGAMAYFALEACKSDMIGLAFTHATSKVRTSGSSQPFFGTNPICFTAPMKSEGPFCFDSAPTRITSNRINQHREDNAVLPQGCAADGNGHETRDPHLAEQLLPIGDYKGYGWAMMVDILCGLLTGMPVGSDISKMFVDPMSQKRLLGQFYGAIRIDTFEEPNRFKQRLQDMADTIRMLPRIDPEVQVQVPGDPEKRCEQERRESGIPVKEFDLVQFNKLAESRDLAPLTNHE